MGRRLTAFLVAVLCLQAETLHVFNAQLLSGKLRAQLHSRFRTRDQSGSELYQTRIGPIINFRVHDRAELIGGYYYFHQKEGAGNWDDYHRTFGGVEWSPFKSDGARLEHRVLLERFHGGSFSSYNRYRSRLRATSTWKGLSPFISAEGLTERGRAYPRFTVGIRWPMAGFGFAETGYELRRSGRVNTHVFATAFQWEFERGKRK